MALQGKNFPSYGKLDFTNGFNFTQFLKKDTKKPLHRYRKQGGFQKRNSLLIFDALMQRHITKIFDIHFCSFLSNSILPKKSGELCRIFWIFCILFVNKIQGALIICFQQLAVTKNSLKLFVGIPIHIIHHFHLVRRNPLVFV